MTTDAFAALRAEHVLVVHGCNADGDNWPCPTARLLAIEAAAREFLHDLDTGYGNLNLAALRDALGESE